MIAGGIDLAVVGMIIFGALVAFAVVRYMVGAAPLKLPQVSAAFTAVAYPITEVAYLSITWSGSGRSVGKKLVGLRVVRNEGTQLRKLQATIRAVLCTLFGGISLLWSAFSSRNAAVHDLVVHTVVVHDWSDVVRTEIDSPMSPAVAAPAVAAPEVTAREVAAPEVAAPAVTVVAE